MPSVKERKQARQENRVHAYGVRGSKQCRVCLREQDANAKKGDGEIKLFDSWNDVARNIREASRWAGAQETNETSSADLVSSEREHDVCNRKTDDKEVDKGVAWNCAAKPFVPQCCRKGKVHVGHAKPHEEKSGPVLRSRRCNETKRPKSTLKLRQILQHPQVSNVRPVKKEVKDKMDKFTQCGHDEWILDLQGTTAKQVQRRLREQLIQDLKEGSDEAAFVCSQLGIDTVPRADQLELMIAAMPGVAKLVFEGTEAKSGLSMEDWRELHASHCDKGCTKDKVHDECYFRVIHHFLQCGYDPELEEGRSWEEFKKHFPAYVDMWRGDEERCRAAWKKWVDNSAGLLDELTEEEPDFAVPLLPATRSKHKWRYLKYGIPYKVRLCLDFKAAQVNAATQDWKFRYRALDDIAASVQKGDWLASVDISRFYLRLPAGQKLRTVQWVQDPGSYAQSTKLNNKSKRKLWRKLTAIGFGLKTAPAWASVVSAELVRILTKSGVRVVGCFLDDLLIAGASKQECQAALDEAIKIMKRLGLPANDKTIPPKSPEEGIVFLGVHIRTSDMRFTISEEHRQYAIDRVGTVLDDGVATKGDLASIAGVLNWISFVFVPGRPRRQIIYDAARLGSTGRKKDKVEIRGALQRQLQWWRNSLKMKNFVGSRIWEQQASPRTMLIRSDASGEDGWGACVAGFHFAGPWPEALKDEHMLFKEIVPVTLVIALLSAKLKETVFGVAVDNTGVAFAVNKLSCRDRITLRMLQQITTDLDAGGHTVLGAHIRRHRNKHTDAMSHALAKFMWNAITREQQHSARVKSGAYWLFPFVAQELETGQCMSGTFVMRRSLFAKLNDVSNN